MFGQLGGADGWQEVGLQARLPAAILPVVAICCLTVSGSSQLRLRQQLPLHSLLTRLAELSHRRSLTSLTS